MSTENAQEFCFKWATDGIPICHVPHNPQKQWLEEVYKWLAEGVSPNGCQRRRLAASSEKSVWNWRWYGTYIVVVNKCNNPLPEKSVWNWRHWYCVVVVNKYNNMSPARRQMAQEDTTDRPIGETVHKIYADNYLISFGMTPTITEWLRFYWWLQPHTKWMTISSHIFTAISRKDNYRIVQYNTRKTYIL